MKPTILLAMRPQGAVAVVRAIGEYAQLVPVATYAEAVAELRANKAIDLVICARLGDTEVPRIALEATGVAATTMGATAFLDLPIIRPSATLDQEFRSAVLRHARRR